jgi:hypothetical protein
MSTFAVTDLTKVKAFFRHTLGVRDSEDFRGVLHVPTKNLGLVTAPDHVAVAIAYNSFVGNTCAMHVVIQQPQYLTRRIIRDAFDYAFNRAGLKAILGIVDASNARALRFDRWLGFKNFAVIPEGGVDGDLVVLKMTRADCKWLDKD